MPVVYFWVSMKNHELRPVVPKHFSSALCLETSSEMTYCEVKLPQKIPRDLYNLNYDNIPLKLIFRKKQIFDVKKSILWFFAKLSIFHLKKSLEKTNSDFSEKLFEELQELKSILTIYFNEKVNNFTKNQEIDFLHQISVFSQKSVSEEYYLSLHKSLHT